ncbi:MAG: hypothetical protein SYC29_16275 [Planctomycetota bacterium]|nr:hypothetical protein [Planctomycetota bacterium]
MPADDASTRRGRWFRLLLWLIALLITLAAAVYQRWTGPSYPVRGEAAIGGATIRYRLPRSEDVGRDVRLAIAVENAEFGGFVRYRRYKSDDDWSVLPLSRNEDGELVAHLPEQPPAGKLMYTVHVQAAGEERSLTGDEPVILRYKGAVPPWALIPHVLFMFGAMLVSNRTGLEALDPRGRPRRLMLVTIVLLLGGAFVFGPIVQKYAFDAFWTGFPFGYDLTDNKALVAMLFWLAAWAGSRGRERRGLILLAAAVMFIIFMIPHSLLGSELDYTRAAGA